ncbi:MAG TPA: hypothetical protein VF515_07285 [Candidatus Binatia bacterium]|jgi:hypothetical protein
MVQRSMKRGIQVAVFTGVFVAGFLCGSMTQQRADAQLGELGKEAVKQAGESGGALGSVVKLGESIVDMQQHVDGLQKNIEVLKKVKAGLGG